MSKRIDVTYAPPNDEAPPVWTPGDARDKRVSFVWRPCIGCGIEQRKRGTSLVSAPDIPWTSANIAEIQVESRKAFEILRRLVPGNTSVLVRINPPTPGVLNSDRDGFNLSTVVTHGSSPEEIRLGREISTAAGAKSSDHACIVFAHRESATVEHLAIAIERGLLIVTSDAGAAEEYLTRFAVPRTWHIARSWEAREWIAMIDDLRGKPSDVFQTSAVDVTPFVPAWGDA